MKKYKVAYSLDTPVYDIIIEAENEDDAYDKANDKLCDQLDYEFDICNIEEVKEEKNN